MQTFLQEIAADIIRSQKPLDRLTVIFPNRRAVLYFRKDLAALLTRPSFAPAMTTIEDFFAGFSPWKVPEKLLLIQRLYHTYFDGTAAGHERETFDKFYFWGDMLLRDFEEIDKYRIPPELLFRDLTVQKELDAAFDFLTDEQRLFLQQFWSGFESNVNENKKKFLAVWNRLLSLYQSFRERLATEGLAYEGMLQRSVVDNLGTLTPGVVGDRQFVFAGFNALTRTEEALIAHFVARHGADVYWDTDSYYVNNNVQEAGRFFREYQRHEVLGRTFTRNIPSNLSRKVAGSEPGSGASAPAGHHDLPSLKIFGAPDPVSQAKHLSQLLRDELARGMNPEETVIVLPDEKLLIPVLHGLSPAAEKLNVTMGFPLSSTPMFSLAELLVDLQISRRADHFNHRQVLALLGHPYIVAADFARANEKRKEILKHNWVHIPAGFLATAVDLHREIFVPVDSSRILSYLREITTSVGNTPGINDLDKEYAYHFLLLLNRMEEAMWDATPNAGDHGMAGRQSAMKSFLRLLRQLIQAHKIPFSGEPLRGLQVMGVLETRNLDYRNVFVLSLNEGSFPGSGSKGSYIPFNIRKAYGLPTVEHQDAMYAYLFYRVLQRAENVFLFYNSETDVLGQGEMSRYLQQLIYESGIPMTRSLLHNTIDPAPVTPITIPKSDAIKDTLRRANEGNAHHRGISPSALNMYIECRLRFYLRYVARIREADEVEEDLDARILGNFLHNVMELLYNKVVGRVGSRRIERQHLDDAPAEIDKLIDQVFIAAYRLNPDAPVEYAGQRVVVREIVRRFARRIIETDRAYTPFVIEATEQGGFYHTVKLPGTDRAVVVSGKIDRIDRKDDVVRIIDYKTGKDQLDFESVASLFVRDGKRNKAAFQTLLYALLYHVNTPASGKIVPGLINRVNLFDDDFQFGLMMNKAPLRDAREIFEEFSAGLTQVLHELYESDTPFDQTTNTDICKVCEFREICYRG